MNLKSLLPKLPEWPVVSKESLPFTLTASRGTDTFLLTIPLLSLWGVAAGDAAVSILAPAVELVFSRMNGWATSFVVILGMPVLAAYFLVYLSAELFLELPQMVVAPLLLLLMLARRVMSPQQLTISNEGLSVRNAFLLRTGTTHVGWDEIADIAVRSVIYRSGRGGINERKELHVILTPDNTLDRKRIPISGKYSRGMLGGHRWRTAEQLRAWRKMVRPGEEGGAAASQ